MPSLFLINDDEPRQFTPREVTIIRDDLRVEGQPALAISIEPTLENAAGGRLGAALLVGRHRDVVLSDFVQNPTSKGVSVFVCRFEGDIANLPRHIAKSQVSIVFWGRLGGSKDFMH
jgi:hypothetical protein